MLYVARFEHLLWYCMLISDKFYLRQSLFWVQNKITLHLCKIYARIYNHVDSESFPFAEDMSIVLLYFSAIGVSLNVLHC